MTTQSAREERIQTAYNHTKEYFQRTDLPGYTGRKEKNMRKLKEFYYLATLGEEEKRLAVPIMLTEGQEIVNIVKHATRLLALTAVPNKEKLLDGVDAFNQYFESKGILNPNLSDFYINCHVIY